MAEVYFISDLHLGHKRILEFSPCREGNSVHEHDEAIVHAWNSVVTKRDLVWVLGDVCFDIQKMSLFSSMQGTKRLVRGNHDKFQMGVYTKYFESIHGLVNYKGFWLSHAPIHTSELRGRRNIHGHTHSTKMIDLYGNPDDRYINVCVEQCSGVPVSLTTLRNKYASV